MALRTKTKAAKAKGYPVAHIVTPARKLHRAKNGDLVAALCGAIVSGDPDPAAGICSACVLAQFEADDKATDAKAQARYDAGTAEGRRTALREAHDAVRQVAGGASIC